MSIDTRSSECFVVLRVVILRGGMRQQTFPEATFIQLEFEQSSAKSLQRISGFAHVLLQAMSLAVRVGHLMIIAPGPTRPLSMILANMRNATAWMITVITRNSIFSSQKTPTASL